MDVQQRGIDARYWMAGHGGTGDRAASRSGLVSGGRMALKARRPWWRERNFTAIDIATLAYVVIATGAVALSFEGDNITGWVWLLLAHALIVCLVFLAPRARNAGPVGRFLGDWYPMLLLAALYGEIGVLTLDAGFQNDLLIQRLEAWVFGSQICYRWIRETPSQLLSWVLH